MLNKTQLLTEARNHLTQILQSAKNEAESVQASIIRLRQRVRNFASIEGKVEPIILANNYIRQKQLEQIVGSPYFVRCDYVVDNMETKVAYIGKFQLSEAGVYSWVTPIAQLRFGDIGPVNYQLPSQEIKAVSLVRKDQYMITDSRLLLMASEAMDYERTLIHQEYFSELKSEFALPEIIARMERAQDQVIRADYRDSFLISGPAGSGKTTLAFHRIAYLTQSPDTTKLFPGSNIIVFVQDESTKNYFRAILPQLGIEEVQVTTFETWAFEALQLTDLKYVWRYGETAADKNLFEWYKSQALKALHNEKNIVTKPAVYLENVYRDLLPPRFYTLFQKQLKEKLLDRFDLTLLLSNHLNVYRGITREQRVVTEDKHGTLKMQNTRGGLAYSFMVVDEAENYSAEQIKIFQACVNDTKAMLYVGDLSQQTRLGTIKNWQEVGEQFLDGRHIVLEKSYRNTKQVLEYIRNQGYEVEIQVNAKNGPAVEEKLFCDSNSLAEYIKVIALANVAVPVGVLLDDNLVNLIPEKLCHVAPNIKAMTIAESQGVEFEVVIIIFDSTLQEVEALNPGALSPELKKIQRDLRYVALTRSTNKLYVITYNQE
ncbi:MAG: UvrD-helicase domain-containing protein [Candidatus Falkowbacteria bacterium]